MCDLPCAKEMTADNGDEDEGEKWEKMRLARKLRELYHGRFTQKDSIALLNYHNWDLDATVDFTLTARTGELREVLGENDWQVVKAATRNDVLRESARSKEVPPEFRQFACEKCDHMWWAKVPERKMVSRCRVCKTKMDALSRDLEWGWAVFECSRGHEFHDHGAMGKTQYPCKKCGNLCFPVRIEVPLKRYTRKKSGFRHCCAAPNCFAKHAELNLYDRGQQLRSEFKDGTSPNYFHRGQSGLWVTNHTAPNYTDEGQTGFEFSSNAAPKYANTDQRPRAPNFSRRGQQPNVNVSMFNLCVHPSSLTRKVVEPSTEHVSTGSTVKTYLSQDELESPYSQYEPSLADIHEIPRSRPQ